MIQSVWKFQLKPGLNKISMPFGAHTLKVSAETGEPCLWVLVSADPDHTKVERKILAVGTGWEVPSGVLAPEHYLGTFFVPAHLVGQMMGLSPTLVYHVFNVGHCSDEEIQKALEMAKA